MCGQLWAAFMATSVPIEGFLLYLFPAPILKLWIYSCLLFQWHWWSGQLKRVNISGDTDSNKKTDIGSYPSPIYLKLKNKILLLIRSRDWTICKEIKMTFLNAQWRIREIERAGFFSENEFIIKMNFRIIVLTKLSKHSLCRLNHPYAFIK